jgi:hypothetical protein
MVPFVPPVTFHDREVPCPAVTVTGLATKPSIEGGSITRMLKLLVATTVVSVAKSV